jgi:aspartyl-tRNA(Asn)/glutamyl-tRNA(Gln) amidotransferase subunit B
LGGGNSKVVEEILAGKESKTNFLVGQIMRVDQDRRVDGTRARSIIVKIIEEQRKSNE